MPTEPVDDYDSLSKAAAEHLEAGRAETAPAEPPRDLRAPLLVGLLVVWACSLVYAIPRFGVEIPAPTADEKVRGALVELEGAASYVDACLQAESAQLPAALPSEWFPGVDFEATGAKAYRLAVEVDGERIGLEVDGDRRSFTGKGTEPYQARGGE